MYFILIIFIIIIYHIDDHGDPNYTKNAQSVKIPQKVPKLQHFNSVDNDSDDDYSGFKIMYDDLGFSNRSQLKLKGGVLSKSQDSRYHGDGYYGNNDSYENSNSNSNPNSPNVKHMYIVANPGVESSSNGHDVGVQSGSYKNNGFRDHHSPPLISNVGMLPRVDERTTFRTQNNQESQTHAHPHKQNTQENVIKYQEPRHFVPVTRPIPNAPRVTQTEAPRIIEYEFQELSVDFLDEPYQTLGRVNLKDRLDYYNSVPVTEPKSEARVFVNNGQYQSNGSSNQPKTTTEPLYNTFREGYYSNGFDNSQPKINQINVNSARNDPIKITEYPKNRDTPYSSRESQIVNNPQISYRESQIQTSRESTKLTKNSPQNEIKKQPPSPPLPPPPPPLPPPLPGPSFFKKFAKTNQNNQNGDENQMANIRMEIAAAINSHENLKRNTSNNTDSNVTPSLLRFVKQTPNTRLVKNQGDVVPQASPKKRTRETPSPFTIDRIVDEAFDYISDQPSDMPKNNETFTDKARRRLVEFQKNRRNSLSNSSINSSIKEENINNRNRFTLPVFSSEINNT